mmetsp:Transcript_14916/g.46324  ORF Transcript_14916/g.46324 Transcript_14916/m.46324 type:complete len:305 (-) Transcript_14916:217-1131(-)
MFAWLLVVGVATAETFAAETSITYQVRNVLGGAEPVWVRSRTEDLARSLFTAVAKNDLLRRDPKDADDEAQAWYFFREKAAERRRDAPRVRGRETIGQNGLANQSKVAACGTRDARSFEVCGGVVPALDYASASGGEIEKTLSGRRGGVAGARLRVTTSRTQQRSPSSPRRRALAFESVGARDERNRRRASLRAGRARRRSPRTRRRSTPTTRSRGAASAARERPRGNLRARLGISASSRPRRCRDPPWTTAPPPSTWDALGAVGRFDRRPAQARGRRRRRWRESRSCAPSWKAGRRFWWIRAN